MKKRKRTICVLSLVNADEDLECQMIEEIGRARVQGYTRKEVSCTRGTSLNMVHCIALLDALLTNAVYLGRESSPYSSTSLIVVASITVASLYYHSLTILCYPPFPFSERSFLRHSILSQYPFPSSTHHIYSLTFISFHSSCRPSSSPQVSLV